MNNLFAGLSALAPGALNASAETPQDIPPAELMNLCMKMNKRMQAMEAKGRDLVKKRTMVLMERQKLLDMMKTVMPIPILPKDDSDLDFVAIEAAWAQFDVQRRTQVSDLEEKVVEKEQLMQKSLHAMEEQYKQIIADLRISQAKLSSSETSSPGDVSTVDEANELQRSEQLAELEAAQKRSIDAVIEAEKEKMVRSFNFPFHLSLMFTSNDVYWVFLCLYLVGADCFQRATKACPQGRHRKRALEGRGILPQDANNHPGRRHQCEKR